jgi:transcriptional regulator with XRE-family HTH domain
MSFWKRIRMSKLNRKIVKAVRVKNTDLGRVVGESLKRLRELAGLTQNEIAVRLDVGQAAVSKIEHRGDVQISSLQKYVEALGATYRMRINSFFQSLAMNSFGQKKTSF